MDFRIKCVAQHIFSAIPGGRYANFLMQRYVTHSLPISDTALAGKRAAAQKHLRAYTNIHRRMPKSVFEFGSGWDLAIPIEIGRQECRVLASDNSKHAAPKIVEDTLRRLGVRSLAEANVEYTAPLDARQTGLPADSFDLIISNSVLEHIPASDIPSVLAECRRLLAPDGVCSFFIDYTDHWSHFDRSLHPLNFLRYRSAIWPLYNPRLHYQNRLRHGDYLALMQGAGFRILNVEAKPGDLPPFAPQWDHTVMPGFQWAWLTLQ